MSEVLIPIPHLPDIICNWVWLPDPPLAEHQVIVLEFLMSDMFVYGTLK